MITWIASYPKSGNTWVRGFLSAYLNEGKLDINKMRLDVDDITGYYYHIVSPMVVDRLPSGWTLQLRGAALAHMATTLDYPLVKTHSTNAEINGVYMIPRCFTKKAIYILRDPRDIVVSLSHQLEWSLDECIGFINNPQQMIHKREDGKGLFNFVGMWAQHVVSWGDEKNFRVGLARYEDFMERPEESFKKILDFLEWEFNQRLFEDSLNASSFSEMQRQETENENGFVENRGKSLFFREGKVGNWRNVLNDEQVEKIEEQHFDIMERLKYELVCMKVAV